MRFDGKRNVYEDIVAEWKRLIEVGALRAGEKLPSVRAFAVERKVNPNTVAKAYAALEEEEIIRILPKKGAYVLGEEKEAKFKRAELKGILTAWKAAGIERATVEQVLSEVYAEETRDDDRN